MTAQEAFPFELCLCLGFAHPDYILDALSGRQYLDWMRFARDRGFGIGRNDIFHGMLCSLIYNSNRPEHSEPLQAVDFMCYDEKPDPFEEEITQEELSARIMAALRHK